MQLPALIRQHRLPYHGTAEATPIGERLVSALLETFELLGRELGGAVLMHPSWPGMSAAPLLPAERDVA